MRSGTSCFCLQSSVIYPLKESVPIKSEFSSRKLFMSDVLKRFFKRALVSGRSDCMLLLSVSFFARFLGSDGFSASVGIIQERPNRHMPAIRPSSQYFCTRRSESIHIEAASLTDINSILCICPPVSRHLISISLIIYAYPHIIKDPVYLRRNQTRVFTSVPIPSISTLMVSPALSQSRSPFLWPIITPEGVPVKIRSPGINRQ